MLVVDTNIVVRLACESEHTALARHAQMLDPAWALPSLWQHEFLNALVMMERHQDVSEHMAMEIWRATRSEFALQERAVDIERAMHLAVQHHITGYDAQFVALAEELDVPLLTEDRDLLRKFPRRAVSLETFCSGTGRVAERPATYRKNR